MRERGRNGGREGGREGSFKVRTGTTDAFFWSLDLWIVEDLRVFHIYFVKHIIRVLPELPEDGKESGKPALKTLLLNATPSPLVS